MCTCEAEKHSDVGKSHIWAKEGSSSNQSTSGKSVTSALRATSSPRHVEKNIAHDLEGFRVFGFSSLWFWVEGSGFGVRG